jgi:membrane-bound lytic murein transglycosylase A
VVYAGSWLRGLDLNQRPLGYEPNELPGCSTPR